MGAIGEDLSLKVRSKKFSLATSPTGAFEHFSAQPKKILIKEKFNHFNALHVLGEPSAMVQQASIYQVSLCNFIKHFNLL